MCVCVICVEKKNQLDVTELFIALMILSTCFRHFYAHHQELENVCVITAYGVQCLVAGCRGQVQAAGCESRRGMLHDVQCSVQCLVAGCRGSGAGSRL